MLRSASSLPDLFKLVQVEEISSKKTLVSINDRETVESALKIFLDRGISSAPVQNDENKCTGFVDLIDLVAFLWEVFQKGLQPQLTFEALSSTSSFFCGQSIGSLSDFSQRNPFVFVPFGSYAGGLMSAMRTESIKRSIPIHRVVVVETGKNEIVSIVSQRDLLEFIGRNISCLGLMGQQPILSFSSALKWPRSIFSVQATSMAIDAFRIMHLEKVSSVAVLNGSMLLCLLSVQSIKGITRERLPQLFLPVRDFIIQQHAAQNKILTPPVTCPANSSLESVILKMVGAHVLHVVLIDTRGFPFQVVSASDVLNLIQMICEGISLFPAPFTHEIASIQSALTPQQQLILQMQNPGLGKMAVDQETDKNFAVKIL